MVYKNGGNFNKFLRRIAEFLQDHQKQKCNRPLPSLKDPHFQNEAKCTTFLVKRSFIRMRIKNHSHIKG